MTHTIELSPRAERRLSDKARRAGLSMDKYLSRIAERDAEALEPIEAATAQSTLALHFSSDPKTRNAQLRTLLTAPVEVREATMRAAAEAAAAWYDSAEGRAELADWRALDGEDFDGFEDEDIDVRAERAA
jgi:hypothetical protein